MSSGSRTPTLAYSRITEQLLIAPHPRADDAEEIAALGVRLLLAMHWWPPPEALAREPLRLRWLPTVDSPFIPMPLGTLRAGVEAALPVMDGGDAVMTFCKAGVHRSVAMACCVLIARGMGAEEAMDLVSAKRAAADPRAWHIRRRIVAFERAWATGSRAADAG